jgi:hypothetical protein
MNARTDSAWVVAQQEVMSAFVCSPLTSVVTWPIRCLPENVHQRYLYCNLVALIRKQCRARSLQRDYNDQGRKSKMDNW